MMLKPSGDAGMKARAVSSMANELLQNCQTYGAGFLPAFSPVSSNYRT